MEVLGSLLLFFLVFGMSATVDIKSMQKQVQNKYAIMTGVFLQFVLLPFLGFVVVKALNMSHAMGLTLLVVTSSPGGSYSNWWCSMFNADLALSVTMTAISTLLSTIMLPLNLLVYTSFSYEADVVSSLDWMSLFIALGVVIGAIGLGLMASAKVHSHRFNRMANMCGNVSGIALVVFSATLSNTGAEDLEGEAAPKIWDHDWVFYVGVALPCVLGLVISNILTSFCKLKKPERVTVSVECCYQNVGIATSVALTMFEGADRSEAMAVPLYYGIVEAAVVGLYCVVAWKIGWTKAPASAKLWEVLFRSYEVIDAEHHELQEVEITLSDGTFEDVEKTSKTGGTLFHYFRFDNICTKLVDDVCIKSPNRQGSFCTVDEDADEECCYKEHIEKPTFAVEPESPKEPSGYGDVPLNVSLVEVGDGEVEEMGSGLAVAMQQRWRWHRRTRSAEAEANVSTPGSSQTATSGLPKPSMAQRNHTIATETPSASFLGTKKEDGVAQTAGSNPVQGRSIHVGYLTKERSSDVEMGYISSASESSIGSEENFQEKYIPPPSPMSSPPTSTMQNKLLADDGQQQQRDNDKDKGCSLRSEEDDER